MSEDTQTEATTAREPRLKARFHNELVPQLMRVLGIDNSLGVPRLTKIVLNIGVGRAKDDKKFLEEAQLVLRVVSGQRPVVTHARRSVAGFQLRSGATIGCKVTLRGARMYEFLDRLISIVLPRIRDFRGLSPDSFDGHGNYSIGIREHIVFPEADPDAVEHIYGMDITICTTASSDSRALALLTMLGMPFRQESGTGGSEEAPGEEKR
jgi:large subunit ribosomal protein L5